MLGHKDILKMGNPILRQIAEPFTDEEIKSEETKSLIKKMWKKLMNYKPMSKYQYFFLDIKCHELHYQNPLY